MRLRCPNVQCRKLLDAPDDLAGTQVKCPTCGEKFRAPSSTVTSNISVVPESSSVEQISSEASAPEATLVMAPGMKPDWNNEDPLIGILLGGCRLIVKIGEGGMGTVYKARHEMLDIDVAVKIVPKALADKRPDFVDRFQREARAAAMLDHPNVVRVHNVGQEGGQYFLVMEFVEGESLKGLLESQGQMEMNLALVITEQVLKGLAAAHSRGIIHRDIKPDNILIKHLDLSDESARTQEIPTQLDPSGRASVVAKIADLGLAKVASHSDSDTAKSGNTVTGMMMGTVDFMAPEQADDAKRVDARADLYSLGCAMFQMICGEKPYSAESTIQIVMKHMTAKIPDPVNLRPDLQPEISDIIKKLLAKQPTDRFQSAEECLDALWKARGVTGDARATMVGPGKTQETAAEGSPCPNAECGKPNQKDARWCAYCGTSLMVECIGCAGEVRMDQEFCTHCGMNIFEEKNIRETIEEAKQLFEDIRPKDAWERLESVYSKQPKREDLLEIRIKVEPVVLKIGGFLRAAQKAQDNEDFELLKESLNKVLELNPHDEDIQKQLDDIPSLIRELEIKKLLNQAKSALRAKKPREALPLYEQLLSLDSDHTQALRGLEKCQKNLESLDQLKAQLQDCSNQGDLKEAEECCQSILEIDTDDEEVPLKLFELEQRIQDASQTIEEAEKLVEAREWGLATELWQKALDLWPANETAKKGLADTSRSNTHFLNLQKGAQDLLSKKELDRAEEGLKKALEAGEWAEGEKILRKVRMNIQNVNELLERSSKHIKASEWSNAISTLKKVKEYWPSHTQIKSLYNEASTGDEQFKQRQNNAQELFRQSKLSSAIPAIKRALDVGAWPEGEQLLKQAQSIKESAKELISKGQQGVKERSWRAAVRDFREAKALDFESVPEDLMQKTAAMANRMDGHLNSLKTWDVEGRFKDIISDSTNALEIGKDPEIKALQTKAKEKLKQVKELEAPLDQLEADVNPRSAVEILVKVQKLQPYREDVAERLLKNRELVELADDAIKSALQSEARGKWYDVRKHALAALKADSQLTEARKLIEKAELGVKKQAKVRLYLAVAAAAVVVVVAAAGFLQYRKVKTNEFIQTMASGNQQLVSGDRIFNSGEEKYQIAIGIGQTSQLQNAIDSLKTAIQSFTSAKDVFQSARDNFSLASEKASKIPFGSIDADATHALEQVRQKEDKSVQRREESNELLGFLVKLLSKVKEVHEISKSGGRDRALELLSEANLIGKQAGLNQSILAEIQQELGRLGNDKFNSLIKEGDQYVRNKKWTNADIAYKSAKKFAEKYSFPIPMIQQAEKKLAAIAREKVQVDFDNLMKRGEQKIQAGNAKVLDGEKRRTEQRWNEASLKFEEAESLWKQAIDHLAEANKVASKNSLNKSMLNQAKLRKKQAENGWANARFATRMVAGEAEFATESFDVAIKKFNEAVQIAIESKLPSKSLERARTKLQRTQSIKQGLLIYRKNLDAANKHFAKKEWSEAAKSYKGALEIAEQSKLDEKYILSVRGKSREAEFSAKMKIADDHVTAGRIEQAGLTYRDAETFARKNKLGIQKINLAIKRASNAQMNQTLMAFRGKMDQARRIEQFGDDMAKQQNSENAVKQYKEATAIYYQAESLAKEQLKDSKYQSEARNAAINALQKQYGQDIEGLLRIAGEHERSRRWKDAKSGYEKILQVARKKNLSASVIAKAQKGLNRSYEMVTYITQYDLYVKEGQTRLNGKQFEAGIESFQQAKKVVKEKKLDPTLSKKMDDLIKQVGTLKVKELYSQEIQRGKDLLELRDWEKARSAFNQAVLIVKESTINTSEKKKLIKEATDSFESVVIEIGQAKYDGTIKSGAKLEARNKWIEASESYKEAIRIAQEVPLKDILIEKAQTSFQRVLGKQVMKLINKAKRLESLKEFKNAIDTYKEAETLAVKNPLSEEIQQLAVSRRMTAEKRFTGTEMYNSAMATAKQQLRAGEWANAQENLGDALTIAEEKNLDMKLLKTAQALYEKTQEMNRIISQVEANKETGRAKAKAGQSVEAKQAYDDATRTVESGLKELGSERMFFSALHRLLQDIRKMERRIGAGLILAAFEQKMEKGQLLHRDRRWSDAFQAFNDALKIGRKGNLDVSLLQQADDWITKVATQIDAQNEYDSLISQAKNYERNGKWEEARKAFQQAETSAGKRLSARYKLSAREQLKNTYQKEFDWLMSSASGFEVGEKWLEANIKYRLALKIAQQTPLSKETQSKVETKVESAFKHLKSALIYRRGDFDAREAVVRQKETAEALGLPTVLKLEVARRLEMSFVLIPAGEFYMGSNKLEKGRDKDEGGRDGGKVRVRITKPYYLGMTEVTQGHWYALMGENPSFYKKGEDHPVENVSWVDCQKFLEVLQKRIKKKCRLPSEAEWEAACRAGSANMFWFGDKPASVRQMAPYMWFSYNADQNTRRDEVFNPENPSKKLGRIVEVEHSPVGINVEYNRGNRRVPRKPNPYGLLDMHGNVFEWCLDWYDKKYFVLIKQDNPVLIAAEKLKERSVRGGSGGSNFYWCRSAERGGDYFSKPHPDIGFRVLLEIDF